MGEICPWSLKTGKSPSGKKCRLVLQQTRTNKLSSVVMKELLIGRCNPLGILKVLQVLHHLLQHRFTKQSISQDHVLIRPRRMKLLGLWLRDNTYIFLEKWVVETVKTTWKRTFAQVATKIQWLPLTPAVQFMDSVCSTTRHHPKGRLLRSLLV